MPANWYRDGTATAVQGSTSVVGTGTLWTTQARMGDLFGFLSSNGVTKLYEVQSVTDNTHLTLALAFGDASVTSGEYAIIRNFNTTMTAETNAMLQSFIREWKLALQQNLKGDPGETGSAGLSFRMGSGAPSVSLGSDGDGYLDFAAWDVYRRESGAWVVRGNVKGAPGNDGAAGSKLYPSTTNPSSGVGIVGDVAINTTSGDVFSRASTGWTLVGNIKGPKGEPGLKGDSVKGDPGEQGVAGSKWHWGAGTPSPTLGVESDNYLNTTTGDCYQKTSGTWVYKSNLKGPRGLPGDVGPAGVTWRGAYSAETAYVANDGVSNAGCSYIARQASTGQTPPTPAAGANEYWGFLSVKGADGEGAGDMTKGVYDPNNDGKVLSAEVADRALNAAAAARATNADHADGVDWGGVSGKPHSFTPTAHALSAHESATLEELNAIVAGGKQIASTDEATTSAKGLMSPTDKAKLDGIAENANNYTHPETHPPSIIAQDANNRFVTDAEKTAWNGKASTDEATTSAKGLMSATDKEKLDGIIGGGSGGAVSLTLVHTTEVQTTTSATYEDLYSGAIVARKAWHSATLAAIVKRGGAGQVRVTVTDGTHTAQAEGESFAAAGQDAITLDCSTLDDNSVWTITIAAKTDSSASITRIKITADPVDAMSPPLACNGSGTYANSSSWTELAVASFLPTWLAPDGSSGTVFSGSVTLTGGATGADVRVTISGTIGASTTMESATEGLTASGVIRIDCPYPSCAAPTMNVKVEGRITAGSGSLALGAWQINMEQ